MTLFKIVFLILVVPALLSEATVPGLPSAIIAGSATALTGGAALVAGAAASLVAGTAALVTGTASLPLILVSKSIALPKILAIKGTLGAVGLKIAGARYLKEKVLIPSSLAGAVSGYKATNDALRLPERLAESSSLAVDKVISHLPKIPILPIVPATHTKVRKTFTIPSIPIPSLTWFKKPFTVPVPNLVLHEPSSQTITIHKQHDAILPVAPPTEEDPASVSY